MTQRQMGAVQGQTFLVDHLRQLIMNGAYEPGAALSEARLSAEFGVSRTPVRECLKQLQSEGLVEIRPKVGSFVRVTTRREIVEMFQVKEALEGMAARLMAGRGRTPELDALEENVLSSERAAKAGNQDDYARLVGEFHETLILGSDNTKLAGQYRILMNQLAYPQLVNRSLSHPGRVQQSTREHHKVFELIRDKDGHRAEQAMRDHVVYASREILYNVGAPEMRPKPSTEPSPAR
ncbi:GntR family transcriptional regulator [Microbacterium kribbense]|uniref:GntR family transcriptional regulator n=1 Tax=Microbacterium kribbense TaxID=433645 RepID=A0ABP7GXD5_9MICO